MRVSDVTLMEHNFSFKVVSGIFLAPPPSRSMDFHRGVMSYDVVAEVTTRESGDPSDEDLHGPASSGVWCRGTSKPNVVTCPLDAYRRRAHSPSVRGHGKRGGCPAPGRPPR